MRQKNVWSKSLDSAPFARCSLSDYVGSWLQFSLKAQLLNLEIKAASANAEGPGNSLYSKLTCNRDKRSPCA